MRRSLVGAAFLLAVVFLLGCDSRTGEFESQGLASGSGDSESSKVDTSKQSGPTQLPDLAMPQELDAPIDPAFEGWLDVGGIPPTLLAIQPQGRRALMTVGYLSVLYDLESGQELKSWRERFSLAAFSGNGKRLVTLGTNTFVRDGETGDEVCRIKGSGSPAIALSDDGSRLAITNDSFDPRLARGVLIFDASSGRLHRAIPTPLATGFRSVAFVANGHRVLLEYGAWRHEGPRGQSPCSLPTSAIWDTETGELVRSLPDEATICTSPDGRWIAIGLAIKRGHPEHRPADSDTTKLTLWDAATGEPVRELGHDTNLRDFAFSPDSERVLVSVGGRLVEWKWRSGERVHESEWEKPVARVYYSPDGRRRFALTEEPSGVDDDLIYRLRGWTIATGDELPIAGYEMSYNTIEELFFFPNCDRFVRFSQGRSAYAERDLLSGEIVREPPKYRADATRCVFMPDGERFLVDCGRGAPGSLLTDHESGRQRQWYLPGRSQAFVAGGRLLFNSSFKYLTLIDVVSNEIVWQYLLEEPKTAAVMSPNGQHVVIGTDYASRRRAPRRRLVLLDTSKSSEIVVHNRHVTALSFHPEGECFAEATIDSVFECEPTKGDRNRLLFDVPGRTLDLQHSLDGKRVLACGVVGHEDSKEPITTQDEGWVALWDDSTGETMRLDGHEGPVTCAAFSPDGERCVTGSFDKTIRVWDTATGGLLHTFRGHLGEIKSVAWSPKGNRILSAAEDGAAFWNVAGLAATPVETSRLATGFEVVEKVRARYTFYRISTKPEGLVVPIPADYQPPPIPVRQAEDWTIIELGEPERKSVEEDLRRWLSLAKSTKRYGGPLPVSEAARFGHRYALRGTAHDGGKVYASWIEKKAILCDQTGEIVRTWGARISAESFVALLPNGEEIVIAHESRPESGDDCYEIVVYDLETGEPKHQFVQDDGRELHRFQVFPTGSMFMLWLNENRVLYDYQKGRIVNELPTPTTGGVSPSSISPDGRFLAVSALANANVTLHDPITLVPRRTLVNPFSVRWFRFSPDGKRLAVGQESHLITMWDVDTARPLWTRRGTGNWSSTTAVFCEDGSRFLKRGSEDVSVLWDAEVGDVLCAVRGPTDAVVLHPNGESLHLGTVEGPMIWPEMEEPPR